MACKGCKDRKPCNQNRCACPVKDMTASCVQYTGDPLECTGIETDQTLEEIIQQLDEAICEKVDSVSNFITLINIGGGSELYKGVNNLGQKEVRTLTSEDGTVAITQNEDTIDLAAITTVNLSSVGDGTPIYLGNQEIASLSSSTLSIESDEQGNIILETPPPYTNDIPRFIVNNLYQGTEEDGSISRPYKTIQGALDAFVGTGTIEVPQFQNGFIIIQEGSGYTFTGNFTYRNINIVLEEGTIINHNPSTGEWLMDLDSLNTIGIDNTLTFRNNSQITLQQQGFRNRGKLAVGNSNTYKTLTIEGTGETSQIRQNKAYDEGYTIFDINSDNDPLYSQSPGSPLRVSNMFVRSINCSIVKIGGSSTIYFSGCRLDAGVSGAPNASIDRKPFHQNNGGNVDIQNCVIIAIGTGVKMRGIFYMQLEDKTKNSSLNLERCTLQCQNNESIFANISTDRTSQPLVKCNYTTVRFGAADQVFSFPLVDSSAIWSNLNINYNVFNAEVGLQADLTNQNTIGVSNSFAGKLTEHLPSYENRAQAALALSAQNKFINRNNSVDSNDWTIDVVMN